MVSYTHAQEDIGTEGRGGYFDANGIICDVMQNHLIQILALVGMEAPVSLDAEDVRGEKVHHNKSGYYHYYYAVNNPIITFKVKLLRSVSTLAMKDLTIGQYTASADGSKPGYLVLPETY